MIRRPDPDEYPSLYAKYLDPLEGDDAVPLLKALPGALASLIDGVDDARARSRYAAGKWSVKEVLIHLSDAERVYAFRALSYARNDPGPFPGFDENRWVPESGADERPLADLGAEFRAVRAASLALFESLDDERLLRRGTANDRSSSVRALAWIIAGHERHHFRLLRERHGLPG